MELNNLKNPIIDGGKYGKLVLTSIYDINDPKHPNVRKTVQELLNKGNQPNIATLREVRPFFADRSVYKNNSALLSAAFPIITRRIGGLETKLPLVDMPTEGGKVYFKGEFYGETVFIVGNKDALLKAARIALAQSGADEKQIAEMLGTPGLFITMDSNYDIVNASKDGKNYTMLADEMPPEQLAQVLKFYFDKFESGQRRKIDSETGAPTLGLTSEPLGLDVGIFGYSKPAPAVPGCYGLLLWGGRRGVSFGDVGYLDDGRFGGAQFQANLKGLADKAANFVNENTLQPIKDLIAAAQKQ